MIRIESDNNEFPISPLNPLIITRIVEGEIVHRAYTLNRKEELESFVEDNISYFEDERTLLGVWCGNWHSDVFQLDFDVTIQKVIEYGRRKFKTFKY